MSRRVITSNLVVYGLSTPPSTLPAWACSSPPQPILPIQQGRWRSGYPWKADPVLTATLVAAIVAGKGVGGVLADRFGWLRVACASLLASLPLVSFGSGTPFLAIVGIFLFNFTMPITLAAVSRLLPGRQGFAFGLTCLALLIGALPVLLGFNVFSRPVVIFASIGLSLIAVWVGLGPRLPLALAAAPKKT